MGLGSAKGRGRKTLLLLTPSHSDRVIICFVHAMAIPYSCIYLCDIF